MYAQITKAIKTSILELYPTYADTDFLVDYAPENIDADIASNIALVLAKKLRKNAMEVAEEIRVALEARDHDQLSDDQNFSVAISFPGFLNFIFEKTIYLNTLKQILAEKDKYGGPDKKDDTEKILVEYFQPNIAKPLHVGHMRSAIIGDAIYRIEKLFSNQVASDTHMGDWGTQFGLLLYAYQQWGNDSVIEKDPINELNKLYVRINTDMEKNPELRECGKAEFVKLEQGDKKNRADWQKFTHWSMAKFLTIYELLDIQQHTNHWPESFYEDKMPGVLSRLQELGLVVESEGAKIVDLEKYDLGTAIIIKSDGGSTYLLRDLATYLYRKHQAGFTRQIYVVDARQAHAFRQLFKILELMHEWTKEQGQHVDFGFMSLPDGALSTRKGKIINLDEVVSQAYQKTLGIIQQKNPELANKDCIARDVAIGALKYFDLSHNRHSDIVFSWDKALNFDGNTGPYLQYTHARIASILEKAGATPSNRELAYVFDHKEEWLLLKHLYRFGSEVSLARSTYMPNRLTEYLYTLSGLFNNYYQQVRILQEHDANKKASRLALLQVLAQVLKNGLYLLGIKAPRNM